MLKVTPLPELVDAITLASLSQLVAVIAFYALLLLGAYNLLKAFHIVSVKSREWMLETVGYSVPLTSLIGSTLLFLLLSGLLITLTSVYGRLREP